MANMRFLYKDIANNATISASSTAGSLVASNMKTEIKSEVHRSVGTSVTYTLDWIADQDINCVILPCTNLTGTATIRVKFFNSISTLMYDSGTITAVPGYNLDLNGQIHNANLFAYGFMSKTTVWADTIYNNIRSCTIDIVDTSNSAGFIDCSKILAGVYWESAFKVENGFQLQTIDGSDITRTNAGELVSDNGFIYDKVNFNFALLPESDRAFIMNIIRLVGINKNFLVSLLPDYSAPKAEQDLIIYGKRSNSGLTYRIFDFYNHSMEITSW